MKLERITLENFRQYFGRQRLEFARDKQRKVTIIHGVNGAGKTSLFLAINWCLYGSGYVNNVGELVSKEAISKAGAGQYVEMSVELSFLHEGEKYIIKRSLGGIKSKDEEILHSSSDGFTMIRMHGDGQSERIGNPIGTINAILPANVRTYFLFDGEKIDDFAKPESAKQVRDAVYLVFKLETLDRARKHLEAVASDYRKELKNASTGELHKLLDQDEKARRELKRQEKRKGEVEAEIESAHRKISDIDQQLRDIQNVRVLQQQRDRADRDLKQRRTELDNIVSILRDISTASYFMAAQSSISKALDILEAKRARGEIPSNIRQQFVQDLITQMQCICGRPFTEDSPEHHRLLGLIKTTLPDSLGDDVLEISAALRAFEGRGTSQRASLFQYMKQRVALMDLIKELEAEADDIGRQLKASPLEEVSRLESRRQEFVGDRDNLIMELGVATDNIDKLTKETDQLKEDISKARKKEKKEKFQSIKLDLAQKGADEIKAKYQLYADDMRIKIEAKTKEIFKRLIWKESYFQDICLSQDFNLEVIDQYGRPARPELSAGERQVLSLSFITAMSRISEEEAPLVMDTPFGRLSSQHRSNITENLPSLADQLVLLVTDEELHSQARANLEPYIGREYRLFFDRNINFTKIEEGKGV